MKSLNDWLAKAEAIGEVLKVKAEVDPNLEMSTIAYLNGKEIGAPTVLFENVTGHPGFKVLLLVPVANLNE